MTPRLLCLIATATILSAQGPVLKVDSPMPPPAWALMERALLKANSDAARAFYKRYVDEKGYLLHTPRWGTLDGPDDAIETFHNWTLLHALGGDDDLMTMFNKAQEGHLKQYSELRTKQTKLAENGAYYKEFITMSDWFHTGEGMRAFLLAGLSQPNDTLYKNRMQRFAGLYMNEDPEAPNYDAKHKIIRSIWTGSKGPMLDRATVYDWVGDAVPGSFHLLHNAASKSQMLDMAKYYPKMLAHCTEYLDSAGDIHLNLAATILHLNSFMLTGDKKYRDWTLEYLNAWKERAAATGGMIPSNIGLDGKLGGEHNGQWWKGTYGWNFTIFDGELEKIAHRNYFMHGAWPGFSNAFLLSGDTSYIGVLRKQMELLYANRKTENGKTLYPQMYGDPRGYKFNGKPEWYHFTDNSFSDRMTEIYLWSMDREDFKRIPTKPAWLNYVEGNDPTYPEKALTKAFSNIRADIQKMNEDPTTPDTRLADYLLDSMPVNTDDLLNLTTGGYFANGRIWVLHSRFRYFDPEKRRAGLPEDVAALVDQLGNDTASVTLVNTNPVEPRTVTIQAGGYAEHQFNSVTANGKTTPIQGRHITLQLAPGAGTRLNFAMRRYQNAPTFHFPWNQ
ncbi:MAG: hypothetical protein NTW74_10970 [Acidobacteria bacterium]|nr:hypothetical protein [Acidobacteriota bacterium]